VLLSRLVSDKVPLSPIRTKEMDVLITTRNNIFNNIHKKFFFYIQYYVKLNVLFQLREIYRDASLEAEKVEVVAFKYSQPSDGSFMRSSIKSTVAKHKNLSEREAAFMIFLKIISYKAKQAFNSSVFSNL